MRSSIYFTRPKYTRFIRRRAFDLCNPTELSVRAGPKTNTHHHQGILVKTRSTIEVYLFLAIFFPNDGAPHPKIVGKINK